MYDSEAFPSSDFQRLANRLANAEVGEVLSDSQGRNVRKESFSTVRIMEGTPLEQVIDIETYLKAVQPLVVDTGVGNPNASKPANCNGVENLVE